MNAYFICVIVHFLNVICVCSTIYESNQKDFWSFYLYLEAFFFYYFFLSLIVFYFVLNLFFNVSSLFLCWKTGVRVFYESFVTWLQVAKLKNAFLVIRQWVSWVAHESLASWPLEKCPDQLFHGYFMSFWSKASHMTLLWLHLPQALFFKASKSKPNYFQVFYIP